MIGWILGALAVGYVCRAVTEGNKKKNSDSGYYESRCRSLEYENHSLRKENKYLRLTFNNHMTLLADYDRVNTFAKSIGYRGAVDLFYYLADKHDERFGHLARFLNKVKHIRNDVAHNGKAYDIDKNFLDKLSACVKACELLKKLPKGKTLYLN